MSSSDFLHLGLALAAIFIPFALGFVLLGRCTGVAQQPPADSQDMI
jgi:hypothetical protein